MSEFKGIMTRVKIYPFALPDYYIARQFKRQGSWLGRRLDDLEYWIIKWIFRQPHPRP